MGEEMRDLESLRAAVAVMRELGVTRWGDIELGDVPPPPPDPDETRPETPQARHNKFWRRVTRSSGAPIPECLPGCRCGGPHA